MLLFDLHIFLLLCILEDTIRTKLKSIRSSYTRASRAHSESRRSGASTDLRKKRKFGVGMIGLMCSFDLILRQE